MTYSDPGSVLRLDDVCPPLFATPRTPSRRSYGPELAQISARINQPFMPWQHEVANVAMEVDPETGTLAYTTVIVILPRQGGKTTLMLAASIHRALAFRSITRTAQNIVYTAQTGQDGYDKWLEHVEILEEIPALERRFKKRTGNNTPNLKWSNGSTYRPLSVTRKSGHSKSNDLVLVDEGWAHEDSALENGLSPTMAARQQPQMMIFSRAGNRRSNWLQGKVEIGRELARAGDVNSSIAYFEWAADREAPGFDRSSPETWRRAHPAIGRTISIDFIRSEFKKMRNNPEDFDQNYLNLWPNNEEETWEVLDKAKWYEGAFPEPEDDEPAVELPELGTPFMAIDITPDRAWGSITLAAQSPDDKWYGEVHEHARGTRWIVDEAVALAKRRGIDTVYIDGAGSAKELTNPLEKKGLTVIIMQAADRAAADGGLFDLIEEGRFIHLSQASLNSAAASVIKRNISESWGFTRRGTASPISPIIAMANSIWGGKNKPVERSNDELMAGIH